MGKQILIADDDCELLAQCVKVSLKEMPAYQFHLASTPTECRRLLAAHTFDVIVLDIAFGPRSLAGLDLLNEIRRAGSSAEIIMLSSIDDEATVLQCLNLGASDFVSKNDEAPEKICAIIEKSLVSRGVKDRVADEGVAIAAASGAAFASQQMIDAFVEVARARLNPWINVVITGPTGTGKDVVAQAIGQKGRPFVTVNCAELHDTLEKSELFGFDKGSFTGATRDHLGLLAAANGGDLFLDEVACLSLSAQAALLRAIENQTVTKIGSTNTRQLKFRVISATNMSLEAMVKDGTFRQDLLARLRGLQVQLAPLRERHDDIEAIARKTVTEISGGRATVSPLCMTILKSYSWPENVRELKEVLRTMVVNQPSGSLSVGTFPADFRARVSRDMGLTDSVVPQGNQISIGVAAHLPFKDAMRVFTKTFIEGKHAFLGIGTGRMELSRALGISKTTLRSYINDFGINLADEHDEGAT